MTEAGVSNNPNNTWSFDAVPLSPMHIDMSPLAKIAPLARAIGIVAAGVGSKDTKFQATDADGYWKQSVLLHTPNGPVHYYRAANSYHDSGSLAVEYPSNVGQLPDELFTSALKVKPGQLHNDFYSGKDEPKNRKLISTWHFPEPDYKGNFNWLEQRDGTIVHYGGPYLNDPAVISGVLGQVHVPEMKSIALEEARYYGYVEALPSKPNVETIYKLENRFKRFALKVANYMGGTNQISATTQESDPRLLSYHATGTDHNQSAAIVVPKLALRGYNVKAFFREPGENVDPGYKVLLATKPTSRGQETLAVYEGLSTFWYSRGAREWRITRGLVLNGKVQLQDFDEILKPVTNKRR